MRLDLAVPLKRGPIPVVGPKVAGLIAQGLAEEADLGDKVAAAFGAEVTRVLLGRSKVLPEEFRSWSLSLDIPSDQRWHIAKLGRSPLTFREWLICRWKSAADSVIDSKLEPEFLLKEVERNPSRIFEFAADVESVS